MRRLPSPGNWTNTSSFADANPTNFVGLADLHSSSGPPLILFRRRSIIGAQGGGNRRVPLFLRHDLKRAGVLYLLFVAPFHRPPIGEP